MGATNIETYYAKDSRIEIFDKMIYWYVNKRNIQSLFSVSKVIRDLNKKYQTHHGATVLYGRVCEPEKYNRTLEWKENHVELFSISTALNALPEFDEDENERPGFFTIAELQKQTSMGMLAHRSGKNGNETISTRKKWAKQSVEFKIDGQSYTAEVFVKLDFTEEEGPTLLFQTECEAEILGRNACIGYVPDDCDCEDLLPGTALVRGHKKLTIKSPRS